MIIAQDDFYLVDFSYQHHQLKVEVADKKKDAHYKYKLDLPGIYQIKNIITVLETLHQLQLKNWEITQQQMQKAFKSVKHLTGLHGRWEKIKDNPCIILDVAHNADGMKQIAEQLQFLTYRELHIVFGMVKDKDAENVLSALPKTANYYFTKAQIPRALDETELAAAAKKMNLEGKIFGEVNAALHEALTHAHRDDLILVCGSVFLVGEVNI